MSDVTPSLQAELAAAVIDIREVLEGVRRQLEPAAALEHQMREFMKLVPIEPASKGSSPREVDSDPEETPLYQEPDVDSPIVVRDGQLARTHWLSPEEARGLLIALRRRVWEETGSRPSSNGLLRKSMIDAFLYHRPLSETEIRGTSLELMIATVPQSQRLYLPDILEIVSRVES